MKGLLKPIIVQPGGGTHLHAFGSDMAVMLGTQHTGGTLTALFEITPPGGGPPPHVHAHDDELFLVVDGRISYFAEDKWTEVGAGGAVYLPRGNVHSFKNVGTDPSKHWVLLTPSGFENFFARCAEEFGKTGGPDLNRVFEISREHGIEFLENSHSVSR